MKQTVGRDPWLLVALGATGAAALGFEVVWSRALIPWVGGTAMAQVMTVAVYMAGLFLGAAWGVRWVDKERPRARFLFLETLAAVLSLTAILGLPLARPMFHALSQGALLSGDLGSALRGLAGGGLMLPATIAMGASFPLAIAALQRSGRGRDAAALAYGCNTLGAALGTCLGGFYLVPRWGVLGGTAWLFVADVLVLALAVWRRPETGVAARTTVTVDRTDEAGASEASPATTVRESRRGVTGDHWLLICVTVGGILSLALEVVLFRLLGMLLGPTARAFTVVLAAYVVGLGIGSLAVRRWLRVSAIRARAIFVGCWWFVALFGFAAFFAVAWRPEWMILERLAEDTDLAMELALRGWVAVLLLVPLTAAFGASYSAAVAAAREGDSATAGRLYAGLTLGNVLGLVLGATWLLPHHAMEHCVLGLFTLALLIPVPLLWRFAQRRAATVGTVLVLGGVVVSFLAPSWNWKVLNSAPYLYGAESAERENQFFLFLRPGFETTVAVTKIGDDRYFSLDGKTDGSTTHWDMSTQSFLGVLPTLLHPDPQRALVVGLGTGQTAADMLHLGYEELDCAELSEGVVEAQGYFRSINRDVLEDPRFRLLETDARTILRYGDEPYDVIVSEPSNVWVPGVAHLFTHETFAEARARLQGPNGLFLQWLHAYSLDPEALRTVARTFLDVFPHATLWTTGLQNEEALFLGSLSPLAISRAQLEERLRATPLPNHGAPGRNLTATDVLRNFVAGTEALRAFAGEGSFTWDRHPSLEYAAESSMLEQIAGRFHALVREIGESAIAHVTDGDDALRALLELRLAATRDVRSLFLPGAKSPSVEELRTWVNEYRDDGDACFLIAHVLAENAEAMLAAGRSGVDEVLQLALEAWPGHEGATRMWIEQLLRRGRGQEALFAVQALQEGAQDGRANAWLLEGQLRLSLRDPAAAERAFQTALERDPLSLLAHLGLAGVYRVQGRTAEERRALEAAHALDPQRAVVEERLIELRN